MKQHLRRQMKAKLAAMPAELAADKSRSACEALISLPEFRDARAVMLYMPLAGELDTAAAAAAAWRGGKTVVVPKADYERRQMIAVVCRSLDDAFVRDRYGIREPSAPEPWPAARIDLIAVPGLAFDRSGARLGRGGGFYDRFLAAADLRAVLCGLAFDEQVLGELPTEGHDRPVDLLVTDKETLRFRR